jgi:membrane protein
MTCVPIFALSLTILSHLPIFNTAVEQVEVFLVEHLLPTTGQQLQGYLHQFLNNIQQISWLSILALFLLILSMFRNIEKAINRIFLTQSNRALKRAASLYLSGMILSPALIACSMIFSSIIAANQIYQMLSSWLPISSLLNIFPIFCSFLVFYVLYFILPNRKISKRSAAMGALCISLCFELAKWAFNLYLFYLPTYQDLYGSLAILPIFCLWIYLVWWLVLLGAELVFWLDHRNNQMEI